jgi:hypothetical protein
VDERQADFAQFDRLDKQSKKVFLRETHYACVYAELTTREICIHLEEVSTTCDSGWVP